MVKKTASENIDYEEIIIDIDASEMNIEDLPGFVPATEEKLR